MDKYFEQVALPWVFKVEGGFSDDAHDKGGTTKYGISLRYLKGIADNDGDGFKDGDIDKDGDVDSDDIRKLTQADAIQRYYQDFWLATGCNELPAHVALCLFDATVNHRPRVAKRLVQQGLGVVADGIIGNLTKSAANKIYSNTFLQQHLSYRAEFYSHIVQADSSQAKFLRGWHRRLFLLQQYLLTGEL